MKTCKTCKHWGLPEGRKNYAPDTEARICNIIEMGLYNYGDGPDYKETLINCESEEPMEHDGALAFDGSGYQAAVVTGPDFGCNKHEEGSK